MTLQAKGDHPLLALIAANVVALLIAYATGMALRELMMVYWIQSVIIGIAAFVRILCLNRFDPQGRHLAPTKEKWMSAFFFLLSYGMFHGFYFVALTLIFGLDTADSATGYLLCALVFAANHGYSLLQSVRRDALGQEIGAIMMLTYMRIVPMHLTILLGGMFFNGPGAFALFGGLKIAADVAMHMVEQLMLTKRFVLRARR